MRGSRKCAGFSRLSEFAFGRDTSEAQNDDPGASLPVHQYFKLSLGCRYILYRLNNRTELIQGFLLPGHPWRPRKAFTT